MDSRKADGMKFKINISTLGGREVCGRDEQCHADNKLPVIKPRMLI
jgi:hypothetical protein